MRCVRNALPCMGQAWRANGARAAKTISDISAHSTETITNATDAMRREVVGPLRHVLDAYRKVEGSSHLHSKLVQGAAGVEVR